MRNLKLVVSCWLLTVGVAGAAWAEATTASIDYWDAVEKKMKLADCKLITESSWDLEDDGWYYVNNKSITITHGLNLKGEVHIILMDGANLVIRARGNEPGIAVCYGLAGTSDELHIYGAEKGTGRMEVHGGENAAGIGGVCSDGKDRHMGNMYVHGGIIEAYGGKNAAGIGGSYYDEDHAGEGSEDFYIYGGTIRAYGGEGAAGVGGANGNVDPSDLFIYGGSLEATGGKNGKGIGGGAGKGASCGIKSASAAVWTDPSPTSAYGIATETYTCSTSYVRISAIKEEIVDMEGVPGYTGELTLDHDQWYYVNTKFKRGTITVSGLAHLLLGPNSDMTAQGGTRNSGVKVSRGDSLEIYGPGKLTAVGGEWAAGIGGDYNHERNGGTVIINGGTVKAIGGSCSAGIGGALGGSGGTVIINSGVVTAEGATDGAGIGGGQSGAGGTVRINGGLVTALGGEVLPGSAGIGAGGYCTDHGTVTIDEEKLVLGTGSDTSVRGVRCWEHALTRTVSFPPVAYLRARAVVDDYFECPITSKDGMNTLIVKAGDKLTLDFSPIVSSLSVEGKNPVVVTVNADTTLSSDQLPRVNGIITVPYRAWTGTGFVDAEVAAFPLTGEMGSLLDGCWYVVQDETDCGRITVNGTVNLILADGATLKACGSNAGDVYAGIRVEGDSELNIYAQSKGTGRLEANGRLFAAGIGGYMSACGTITINGGIVTAKSEGAGAGIGGGANGAGGKVTINGGVVTAEGGELKDPGYSAAKGIGGGMGCDGGSLTINGGTVRAEGSAAFGETVTLGDKVFAYDIMGGEPGTRIEKAAALTSAEKILTKTLACTDGDIEKVDGVWVVVPNSGVEAVTIENLPTGSAVAVKLNGYAVPSAAFIGFGDQAEGVFSLALNPKGEVNGVKVTPTIGEGVDNPFVVGEGSVEVAIKSIPGLKYELKRTTALDTAFGSIGDGVKGIGNGNPIILKDANPPADKAFYNVNVGK